MKVTNTKNNHRSTEDLLIIVYAAPSNRVHRTSASVLRRHLNKSSKLICMLTFDIKWRNVFRHSIHDLRGVQIKFILLNPRSHSAVLTGSVWIAPISLLIFLPETSSPFISLKSLYSCFKSLVYGNKNLLHASLSSFSPYSDETVKGQEVGNKVLTHSIVGLSDSGISRAEMESART